MRAARRSVWGRKQGTGYIYIKPNMPPVRHILRQVCEKTTFKRLVRQRICFAQYCGGRESGTCLRMQLRQVNRKRCVVAVDGFYEWQKLPKGEKQPYFIKFSDDRPITVRSPSQVMERHASDPQSQQLSVLPVRGAVGHVATPHGGGPGKRDVHLHHYDHQPVQAADVAP